MKKENLVSLIKLSFQRKLVGKAFHSKKRFLIAAMAIALLITAMGSASAGCIGNTFGIDFGCGDTITESCTFNGNTSCPSGHGLIIGTDNITIDGNGYVLDGINSACTWGDIRCGILNDGYDNVSIKNLEIKNFCLGIKLHGTSLNHNENNTVENCNIYHNGNATSELATHGIKMEYVFNSTIRNNSIHDTIAHVDPNPGCEDGGNGLFLYKGDYNLITQNKFYNNTKGGLFIKMKPMYNNISYNNLWGNGQGGIILRCKLCDFNIIEHNNASNNYGSGIFMGGNNNTVRYNMICNNKNGGPYYDDFLGGHGYGVNIGRSDGSCNNSLNSNKICGNEYRDVYVVDGVTGNHGDENTCDATYNYNDEGTTGCSYGCGSNLGCVAADGTVYRCGDTVTKSCAFNGSLLCPVGYGLIVSADNIVIDGKGYTITGNKSASDCTKSVLPIAGPTDQSNPANHSAIINNGYDNVVIKNLEVKNFCTGIALKKANNNTVIGCVIHKCGDSVTSTHGIHIVGANNCTITKNRIYEINGSGIGGGCSGGGNGIFMYGVDELHGNYNIIICNKLICNKKSGFFMKMKCMHNIISNNVATGNAEGGITLMCKKSNYNIIEGNNVSGNIMCGIFIGGKNNSIRNNSVFNNGFIGINMGRSDGSYNNELCANTVCGNDDTDIKTCGPDCYGNHGDNNTCDTTHNYSDEGTIGCTYSCPTTSADFDTEAPANPYPSISGTHNGTITPAQSITVNRLYTYACTGTGGHTEYVRIWNESENVDGQGNWSGYPSDYHNVTISPALTLLQGHTYNYTITTGSYPQIVHAKSKPVTGGNITCTKFTDANGKRYTNCIPAIRLFYDGG